MRSLMPVFGNDGFFGHALDNFFDGFEDMPVQFKMPRVDIKDLKDHFEVTADMPGFTKDQVSVTYDNKILTISAKADSSKESKDDEKSYIRRERMATSFKRQFAVDGIDKEHIKADLKDGVLTIELPKEAPETEKGPYKVQIG